MQRRVLAVMVFMLAFHVEAFDAVSSRGVDLSGYWLIDPAASDDPVRLLSEHLKKQADRNARRARQEAVQRPPNAPPVFEPSLPPPSPAWRQRRRENFERMLVISERLDIRQEGVGFTLRSAVDERRYTAGARSQVSMPEGELADLDAGWDGEWFVINRKVRKGPHVVERFRLLKSGQLEYTMRWSGESELAGVKLKRVFNRTNPPAPQPPEVGPTP